MEYLTKNQVYNIIEKILNYLRKDPEFKRKNGDIDFYELYKLVDAEPPATIIETETMDWYLTFKCSKCLCSFNRISNFCPNCGAKANNTEIINKTIFMYDNTTKKKILHQAEYEEGATPDFYSGVEYALDKIMEYSKNISKGVINEGLSELNES